MNAVPMDLATIEEIRQVKYRYLRCVDLKLWDELAEVFTPDATVDYGTQVYGKPLKLDGRDAIVGFLRKNLGPTMITVHRAGQPEITVDGEVAEGIWSFEDTVIATEFKVVITGAAFYRDRYERGADGRWRIAHTGYVRTYEAMMSLDDLPSFRITAQLGNPRDRKKRTVLTQPFSEAIAEAEKIIAGAPFVATEQDLAEGYDYLAGSIQASLRLAWAYQKDFPYFVMSTGPYTKLGLDNPDTLYFHSYLRDDAEYVVTGQRGSTADLNFQVLKGDYSPVEVPDSLSAFDDRAIEIGADGSFELRFGPAIRPPAGRTTSGSAPGPRCCWSGRCTPTGPASGGARSASAGRTGPGWRRRPRTARRWPSGTAWRARSCCPGCGRSSPSPSGSTSTSRSTR